MRDSNRTWQRIASNWLMQNIKGAVKGGSQMNVGDKVKIKELAVDAGLVGKYFGKIGTVEAIGERNVTVLYEDGQVLYFYANELEVIA